MKKILICEDEADLVDILKDRFEEDGWTVDTAMDGEEASSKLSEGKYNLVLLDLLMPKKNGFDVLADARKDPNSQVTPIIVLSNLGQDEDIKKALQLGANDYFVKVQHPIGEILEKAKEFEVSAPAK